MFTSHLPIRNEVNLSLNQSSDRTEKDDTDVNSGASTSGIYFQCGVVGSPGLDSYNLPFFILRNICANLLLLLINSDLDSKAL